MVRKVAPKKVTTRRVRTGDTIDPTKPKPWNYKDSMALSDSEWWTKPSKNQVPEMRLGMGKVSPKWVPVKPTPSAPAPRSGGVRPVDGGGAFRGGIRGGQGGGGGGIGKDKNKTR